MCAKEVRPRLGRGLAALLGDTEVATPEPVEPLRQVPIDLLEPSPFQPRGEMDPEGLEELAASIRERGLLQPLLVRPHPKGGGRFQIVAGERRWRAAGLAKLHQVPAMVQEMSDAEAATAALIENLQREDLNPLEEAEGYNRLLEESGLTHERLAQALGKSRAHITNMLRLLNLPAPVQQAVRKGSVSAGHARALLSHPEPEAALAAVVGRGLSVRQTEALSTPRAVRGAGSKAEKEDDSGDADLRALEQRLTEHLGAKAKITANRRGGGALSLAFDDLGQLEDWISRLVRQTD